MAKRSKDATEASDLMSDFVILNQDALDEQTMSSEKVREDVMHLSPKELMAMHQEMKDIYNEIIEKMGEIQVASSSVFENVGVQEGGDNEKDRTSEANAALDKDAIEAYVSTEDVMQVISSIREAAEQDAIAFEKNIELRELLNRAIESVKNATLGKGEHGPDFGIQESVNPSSGESLSGGGEKIGVASDAMHTKDIKGSDSAYEETTLSGDVDQEISEEGGNEGDRVGRLSPEEGVEKFMGQFEPVKTEFTDFKESAKEFGMQHQSMMDRLDLDFDHVKSVREQQEKAEQAREIQEYSEKISETKNPSDDLTSHQNMRLEMNQMVQDMNAVVRADNYENRNDWISNFRDSSESHPPWGDGRHVHHSEGDDALIMNKQGHDLEGSNGDYEVYPETGAIKNFNSFDGMQEVRYDAKENMMHEKTEDRDLNFEEGVFTRVYSDGSTEKHDSNWNLLEDSKSTYQYNEEGQMISVTDKQTGSVTTNEYNDEGVLISSTNDQGTTMYDDQGRPTETPEGQYTYHESTGEVASYLTHDGLYQAIFNENGQMVEDTSGAYAYDADGNLQTYASHDAAYEASYSKEGLLVEGSDDFYEDDHTQSSVLENESTDTAHMYNDAGDYVSGEEQYHDVMNADEAQSFAYSQEGLFVDVSLQEGRLNSFSYETNDLSASFDGHMLNMSTDQGAYTLDMATNTLFHDGAEVLSTLSPEEVLLGGDVRNNWSVSGSEADVSNTLSSSVLDVYDSMQETFNRSMLNESEEDIEWVTGDTPESNAAVSSDDNAIDAIEVQEAIAVATDNTSESHQPNGTEGLA